LHERDLDVLIEPLGVLLDTLIEVHPALGNLSGDPLPFLLGLSLDLIVQGIRGSLDSSGVRIEYANLRIRVTGTTDDLGLALFSNLVMPDLFIQGIRSVRSLLGSRGSILLID
jgi:hypothetical protein